MTLFSSAVGPATAPRGGPRPGRTAWAFVLAPAVPAAVAAVVCASLAGLAGPGPRMAEALFGGFGGFVAFAFGGYATALVVGVPIYVLVRAAGRNIPPAAAMLLGGMVASSPWFFSALLARQDALMLLAAGTFGLGCIGGIVFSLVRDGWPGRPDADPAREPEP